MRQRENSLLGSLEEEIKEAIWSCGGSKSPGPDRFNFDFFQCCWDIVKEDIFIMMDEFHSNGKLVRGSNSSFIVLIPKKKKEIVELIKCVLHPLSEVLIRLLRRFWPTV